jgi:hypothetical protein
MKYNIDYFKALNGYKYDIYELPEAIKVHVISSRGYNYDFDIKFIWRYGVGFPESDEGCSWCSIHVDYIMTMPDGTKLIMGDPGEFIKEVFNWFERRKHQEVKLVTDEVEFMDI